MLKKTVTYKDFNDEEVTEDLYFHLSKAELVELELSHKGGLTEQLKRILEAEDGKAIVTEFKNILLSSYGQRSEDGKRFIKNQALRDEFESSEAYSTIFIELVTDAEEAARFIQGIIPVDLAEEAAKVAAGPVAVPDSDPEPRTITQAELVAMSKEDLEALNPQIASGEVKVLE